MKRMGLAVLAALALTVVVGTPSASATGFVADSYPLSVTGEDKSVGVLETHMGEVECGPINFALTAEAPSTQLQTSYTSSTTCAWFGANRPWEMNGCKFIFHPGAETAAGVFEGTFDIGPANCGPMTIETIWGCTLSVGAQAGLAATYKNAGSGSQKTVTVEAHATNLKYTGNGGFCGNETHGGGSYTDTWSLRGEVGGKQVGIQVANVPTGIYMAGAKSEEAAKQPRIETEGYPATLKGGIPWAHVIETEFGELECEALAIAGGISSATNSLNVAPTYSKCSALGFNATVAMNGCSYVFHVDNAGPPYTGTIELACSGGNEVEFKGAGGLCTVRIPGQTLASVTYKTQGTSWNRYVLAESSSSSIAYTGTAGFCKGSAEGGRFEGSTRIEAYR